VILLTLSSRFVLACVVFCCLSVEIVGAALLSSVGSSSPGVPIFNEKAKAMRKKAMRKKGIRNAKLRALLKMSGAVGTGHERTAILRKKVIGQVKSEKLGD
jgi:hypothetical protein